jgi:hypothetical protein
MSPKKMLLSSKDMARFIAQGFVRFDEIVPRDLCKAIWGEFERGAVPRVRYDSRPLSECWPGLAVAEVFRLPCVLGVLESLVGPHPQHDHHAVHTVGKQSLESPNLHQDAEYDVRFEHFDIQISLFVHDVPLEMGGTLFLPGSHFRRVHESQIGRYQNVVGQIPTVCKAGTMIFWHHNLWHASRSNHTDAVRYMFKVRINPTVRQVRLWNMDDLDDPEIPKILRHPEPWHGQEARLEIMNRLRLWRSLTDQPAYDVDSWLFRIENKPLVLAGQKRAASSLRESRLLAVRSLDRMQGSEQERG